ncbi:sulfatase [Halococcus saccharolyticus]|uniref:Arylsulfatase, choline-sulfatase n=1 Tax=Halococcus saccharolyticus DSM 5350 TaxID=1227455 RepID=M0MAK0_9EURY|nr:sulfatase [Halococcus saccharolyticus]EMA42776.1 arylsulfatase, choline-sulfatase [Halococcus saccharolyticus DSM 5350]
MSDRASNRNVLFVVMDTVRKDHLSCYGYDRETTPGLERFAEEAAVFEQAVAPAPWTLPVHASMFTGLYPGDHGATQENPYLEDATTLAESLSATHTSACYSSNAWITPYTHLTDGFDSQDNFFEVMPGEFLSGPLARAWKTMNDSERLRQVADWLVGVGNAIHEHLASGGGADSKTPAVIDRTIEFIDGTDEPYFSFINLMDAHLPYHPPDEHREQFAPGVDSTAVCQNSKEYNAGARDIGDDEWEAIRRLYDAEIHHVDDQLDRLFSWMRANGEWEDTLVVVCADHGELHGEHDLYGHEFGVYDPIVNVPLMVKHPDIDAGRYDEQVELIDLYHTVLDHAGVEGEGVSLDPQRSLLGEGFRDEPNAFVEYYQPVVELNQLEGKASDAGIDLPKNSRFYSRMRAARRPAGKYIHNERIADEAYRLDEDPGETENVRETDDPVIAALENSLGEFEADREAWTDVEDDAVLSGMGDDAKQRLEDLGYIE